MKEHPSPLPSWREKLARTSLAFSVICAANSIGPNPESACETAIVRSNVEDEKAPPLGFTFRPDEARYLGLDPRYALEELLMMDFDQVRISMYANQPTDKMVEEIQWQVALAEKYNTDIVLGLGRKAPGWPEEYLPRQAYSETLQKTLAVLQAVGDHEQVKIIQVSNEPLYDDGLLQPEDPQLLSDMINLILPYEKPVLFTSHADPMRLRTETFRQVLALGDAGGIDVYIETSAGRGTCTGYSDQLQKLNQIAKIAEKPLLVTEMQTLPWPDQVRIPIPGRDALIFPFGAQENMTPAEIQKLYKMILINTDAESIFFWEMTKNLAAENNGDSLRMNEIKRIIGQNHTTREHLLYQREEQQGGIISFSVDHE